MTFPHERTGQAQNTFDLVTKTTLPRRENIETRKIGNKTRTHTHTHTQIHTNAHIHPTLDDTNQPTIQNKTKQKALLRRPENPSHRPFTGPQKAKHTPEIKLLLQSSESTKHSCGTPALKNTKSTIAYISYSTPDTQSSFKRNSTLHPHSPPGTRWALRCPFPDGPWLRCGLDRVRFHGHALVPTPTGSNISVSPFSPPLLDDIFHSIDALHSGVKLPKLILASTKKTQEEVSTARRGTEGGVTLHLDVGGRAREVGGRAGGVFMFCMPWLFDDLPRM